MVRLSSKKSKVATSHPTATELQGIVIKIKPPFAGIVFIAGLLIIIFEQLTQVNLGLIGLLGWIIEFWGVILHAVGLQ